MRTNFTILIASDPEHEKVFAEIYCGERFVALVSQEEGLHCLRIEFPDATMEESMVLRKVEMEGFQEALRSAARKLAGVKGSVLTIDTELE